METLNVRITGTSPLMMHSDKFANPLLPETKAHKALTAKRKKTDEDHEAIAKSELAALSSMIQAGLDMRLGEQAKAQLLAEGKDTGTTHVADGDFDVAVEVGKDVSWDQKALEAIWKRIAATGEDPTQYITVKYSVSESRFKAWPDVFRQSFMAARTVKPKPAKFTLRQQSSDREVQ